MKHGTLKNRAEGYEIPATMIPGLAEYTFTLDNDGKQRRYFDPDRWEFTPDKPSPEEVFAELGLGEEFTLLSRATGERADKHRRVKITGTAYVVLGFSSIGYVSDLAGFDVEPV